MRLASYNCDELFVRVSTPRPNFFDDKFFQDPRLVNSAESWRKGAKLELLHYTKNPKVSDYHVHTHLEPAGDNVRLVVNWTRPAVTKKRGEAFPFAEDVHVWVRRFFRSAVYPVRVSAYFVFPRSKYVSSLGLPVPSWFPIVKKRRLVLGLRTAAELPGAVAASVITDLHEKQIIISVSALLKQKLSRLNPQLLLAKFRPLVVDYVEKR